MAGARRICPTCGAAYAGEALFCPADGAPLVARASGGSGARQTDPYLGLELEGRLRLERLVGLGAMGRVYRAWQAGLERAVAVKILHRDLMKKPEIAGRFEREGRVAGGLRHPNVIAVHDAGRLPERSPTEGGEPYLVVEFLDGISLRSALAAIGGPLPLTRALHVALQLCDAMGEAHERGVVHRDLKPENVMLVRCGADPDFVKVLDFGVARLGEADSSLATHAGALLGTATYACPESARGERVGYAGDVYSIATMLFECLVGTPPFRGKSAVDVLIQHAQTEAPDVRAIAPGLDLPEPIARVVARSLAKQEGQRPSTARELGRELLDAALASGLTDAVRVPATLTGPAPAPRSGAPFVRLATALIGASLLSHAPLARAANAGEQAPPAATAQVAAAQKPKGIKAPIAAAPPQPSPEAPPAVEPEPPTAEPDPGREPPLKEAPPGGWSPAPPPSDAAPISGTAPLGLMHAQEDEDRVTRGQIDVGLGFFTLPGARVCIASFAGCSQGDSSLAINAWPLFRRGRWAIGAGVMVGVTSSADAPRNDPPDVPRDHYRRYFSVEITGRYYIPLRERWDLWLGITTGLGVVNDTFQSQKGLTDKAVIGARGVTLLTEGFTLGAGAGVAYQLSESLFFGGGLRVSNWFLPSTPAVDPLGDRASLTGNVATVDLGITLTYRSRLTF